jgi:hypothetical protein
MVSQLSESEQREVDHLNGEIRRLTEECKTMFNERLQLQYDRVQLLKTTFTNQHEHLLEVSLHRINSQHLVCLVLLISEILCYEPEGHGFETWWGNWILSVYLTLLATLGPEVYSASNRDEYQKQKKCFWRVECGQCVRLATLMPSVSQFSRQCGILNISQPYRSSRPISGITLLYFFNKPVMALNCRWLGYNWIYVPLS